ncbi:DNA repair protein RAD50 [Gryllus bimaculatus]|nr:DNA repair protein RAD50 [Gryllus bimaculatus]
MRDMKGMLSSQEVLFQKYVQKLQERDPCCPLCHRNFERSDDAATLIDELRSEVRTVPVRLRNNNEKLIKCERQYETLLQLKSTNDRLKNGKEIVIPKLKKELKDVENQLKNAREKSEELQNDLLTPQMDEGMARNIQGDVFLMDKCLSELKICKTDLSTLKAEIPPAESGRSLEEAQKMQDDLRKEVADLRQSLKSSKTLLETHTDKVQKLHSKKNSLVEEQLKIQGGTQQLQQMRENLAELEVQLADLEEQVQLLKSDVTIVRKDCDDARRTLEEVKTNNRTQIKAEDAKVNELENRFKDLVKYNVSIDEYDRRGYSNELTSAQQSLTDLNRDKEDLQKRHIELADRVDQLKNEISGQKLHDRELRDNLQLMEKEKEEEKKASELQSLSRKHGSVQQSYNQIKDEKKKLETERQSIMKESQQAEGRVEEMRKRLKGLQKEMAEEMYEDADKKYSNALREKTVKEIVDTDLAKYHKAMEWAMTQFHQERMKVINEIIHDLWRNIYRGNDIDYIKIEANAPDVTSDTKRRSYDYRVVQVKNDIEIDMRGRCSAGQKVLACLIIRLALAETLSSQCGILALDEPTTNLDRENIESLAEALAQVVNTRMVNKGFQLIVITHDEEFVSHMKQSGQLSHYHIVTRNEEGKSRITKHVVQ